MRTDIHFWSYLAQFFSEWEMFQTKVVQKIKPHVLCSVTFFENRAVYEIMWKNIVQSVRPQTTICRMRIVCWIPKATDTHTEYLILIAFPLQRWLRERVSLLRHTYIALFNLTLILLTSSIWWAPNNARKWQLGFNPAFKGLIPMSLKLQGHKHTRLQ